MDKQRDPFLDFHQEMMDKIEELKKHQAVTEQLKKSVIAFGEKFGVKVEAEKLDGTSWEEISDLIWEEIMRLKKQGMISSS